MPSRFVGVLGLCVAAGPVLYPAWLAVATRRTAPAEPPEPPSWPELSVLVPAYREAGVIAGKVADVLANGYLGPLHVVVVAEDEETAQAAKATCARVVSPAARLGKAEALNRAVAAAAGEVLVLTDANTLLRPGSLAALARWFADPRVGAVAGEKQVVGRGESAYWRYESWLKRRESRLGSTVALVGELAAVRRRLWRRLPADVSVDDLWIALDVLDSGHVVRYEPAAVAFETPDDGWRPTWERRTRVVAGTFDLLWRRRALLVRPNQVTAQLWGHKLLRQSLGPVAHLLLLGIAARHARASLLARTVVAGHLVAGAGGVALLAGRPVPRALAVPGQLLFLQAVAIGGLLRYLRGDRPALWQKPPRRTSLPRLDGGPGAPVLGRAAR